MSEPATPPLHDFSEDFSKNAKIDSTAQYPPQTSGMGRRMARRHPARSANLGGSHHARLFDSFGRRHPGIRPGGLLHREQTRPGKRAFSHKWKGATWYFASGKNRDLFRAEPEKYAPQYGGYCAYAVSQGYIASIVPEAWKIVDGKLYLNFSLGVQQTWEQDIPGYIKSADQKWPSLLKRK